MRNAKWIVIAALLVAAGMSIAAYPFLPHMVATHWNARGVPDQFSGRLSVVAWTPTVVGLLVVLFLVAPRYERLLFIRYKASDADTQAVLPTYATIVALVAMIFLAFHALELGEALGWLSGSVGERGVAAILSIMAIGIGNLMPRLTRRNAFGGLRFPWVFANDSVWRRTQRGAGYCMVLVGLIGLVAAFVAPADQAVSILIKAMMGYIIGIAIYSFVISRGATAGQPIS